MTYRKFNEFCQTKKESMLFNKINDMCESLALLNVDANKFATEVCLPVILENQFSNEDELIELFGEKLCEMTGSNVVITENVFKNVWGSAKNALGSAKNALGSAKNALGWGQNPMSSSTPQTPTRQVRPPSFPDVQAKAKAIADTLGKNIFSLMQKMNDDFRNKNDLLGHRVLKGILPKINNMIQKLRFVGGNQFSNQLQQQPIVANTNQNIPQPEEEFWIS